jgi:filamentous hemagglutinin family protein
VKETIMSARRSSLFTTSALGALALAAVWGAPAHAQLVQGGTPAQSNGGAPVVAQAGGNTSVTLNGSRTVIDWDRFDINSGERADFIFANRNDIVLNRVGGAAGSTINGDLNGMIGAGGPAGGNIWIYNANGVVIGANARISTGGLLVTTAAVDRATDSSAGGFLDGSATSFGFTGSAMGSGITVQNGAQINSYSGAIALVAPMVTTEAGSAIAAHDGGNVLYGAASKYKISFRQTGTDDLDLIGFEVAGSADGTGESGGIAMGGTTSGNRVFAAIVSKTGVISNIVSTGAVTATNVVTDETGAIVLLGNHNLVNGAAGGMIANAGTSAIRVDNGSTLTAPAVSLITSDSITNNPNGVISAVGGTIDLLAKNGVIFGFGKLTTGTLTAEAYGRIYLSGTNNVGTLGGLRNTTDEIVFSNNASLDIAGNIVAGGEANISVNGVASGNGLIRAATATLSGGGAFNLDRSTTLRYVSAYAGNLTVNSNGNLLIDLSGAGNDYGNTVTLNAASGGIRQIGGDALVGSMAVNARDAIDLGALNQFSSITASSSGGGDILLRGATSFAFAGSTTGGMSVDAGGRVTVGGALSASRLNIVAGGDIDLNRSVLDVGSYNSLISSGGNISITTDSTINIGGNVTAAANHDVSLTSNAGGINQTAGTIAGRQLNIQAAGSIVQNSTAVMNGKGFVSSIVQAGGDLILAGSNGLADYADVTLGWGAGRDVTYHSAYSIFFQTTGVNIGALNLIVDNGSIQQGGGAFTANSFSASATGDIDIGTPANNSIARIGNVRSSAGEVRLRIGANNPLAIDGTISSASRVIFTARGAVSGSGKFSTPGLYLGLLGGGTVNVAGSTNLLELGTSNGDATVRADDSLTLSGALAANGHNLTLIAGTGSITQTGGSFIGMGTLTASAAGDISLTAGNSFSSVDATSTNAGLITLNATGNLDFKARTASTVRVTTGGDATASGANAIDAGTLDVTAGGKIDLDFTGGSAVFGQLSAGDDVLIAMDGDVVLGGNVTAGNGATASLRSRGGAINQSAGTIDATSILLNAGTTISQSTGAALRSTNLSLTSGGNTSLGEANNFTTLTDLAVGGDLTLRNLGNINLSPILGGTGGYRSGGVLTLVSDTGNILSTNSGTSTSRLNASAAGSISLDGTIASLGTITAGQSILLTTYNGSMDLTGNVTGRNISLYADTGLSQSGGIIDADRLNVITNGAISLTGANQIDVVGRLDTDRYDLGTGHNITLRNVGAIVLDYQIEAPDGTVTLTSDTGGISQTIFSDRFIAGTLNASAAGDIVLDWAGTDIDHLGAIRSQGGAVTIVDTDGFDLTGQVRAAGALSLSAGGAITRNGGLVVAGGALNVSASSADLVAGGDIQLGTISTIGNFAIDTDGNLTVAGTIDTTGHTTTLNAAFGAIQHGGGRILNGSVVATALNGINLGGDNRLTSFSGSSTGGGNIVFNNGGSGAIVVGLNTAGSATVTAGGNLSSGGITVDSLSVDAGHIDLTSSVDVNSFTRLAAAYGDILVTNNGSFTVAGDVTTNRPGLRTIDLRANGGGISQTAGTIAGHYVSLRGSGDLVQSGTARIDSNAAYFSGANVLLGGANNLVSNDTDIAATGHLTLRNAGSIDLTAMGGYTAGGVLTLISDTGSITSSDGITATALTAHAANGAVTFNHANNLFSEIRGLSAATNATIVSRFGGFALHGDVDVGGTLSLRAGLWINQTDGRIKATTLDAQLYQTMTTGSVLLGGANDVDNLYVLAASGGGDVLFRDTDGFRVTYAVLGNRVTLTSDAGAITQASGFIDGIQASQLTVSAVDGISLNNDWNGIRTILGLTNTGSGGIDIASRGVNMVLNGNVTAAGQAVSFNARNASLTQISGSIVAESLSAQAQTGIALTSTTNNVARLGLLGNGTSGGIAYTDADSFMIAGAIVAAGQTVSLKTVDTSSFVSQTATNSLLTVGTLNLSGGQGYSLTGNGASWNYITALGNIDTAVQIHTDSNVDLTGTITSPYFELWAHGNVTQSGGRIDRSLNGDVFEIRADRIALTSATNRLGKVDALLTWGNVPGSISAASTGDTKFGEVVARDASLTVTGGSILDYGVDGLNVDTLAVSSAGTVSLGGRIGALGTVTANGDTAFRSSSNLAFTDTVNIGTGRLMLTSTGAISQTGGTITAGAIDVSAATGIDLGRSNNIATITGLSTTNGDISFRNWASIALPGISAPGTVTLVSESGSISQNIGTTLRANRLNASAATFIDLTKANQLASLGTLDAGSTIGVTNHGSFTLTGDIAATSVTLRSTFGAISQTGGVISASDLTASAQNGLDFGSANNVGALHGLSTTFGDIGFHNQGNIVLSDVVALTGAVTLVSDSGSITQSVSTSIMAERLNASAATGITLDQDNGFVRTGTLSNSGSGGIRVKATGNLAIGGTVTATGQAVRFDVGGALTQSVALGAYSNLTINAGTGLYLDQANNFGATTFSLSTGSGDITVRNVGNLAVPALSAAGGTIRLISDTGTIGQTGILTANTLFAEARREISLGGNNVITNVGRLVNTTGTITFRDIDGFNITGDIRGSTATGERVNLIAGGTGDIVQTGGAIVVDKLRATAGGNLTLDGSANSFINVEVLSAGGDIKLRAQDSFVLGHTVDAGGTATLTSTNGFIGTDVGSIGHVRADALYVNAATGIDINLPGNITPKVSLISAAGNIRYTTQGAMELLALKTPDRAIVSADALTQSGAIDVGALDALAGDIRLDMAGNRIGSIHAAMATGGDLVITDEDGFDIAGNLSASGAISLTAGGTGSITQSGGVITAPTVSLVAGGDITLDRANAAGVYNARSATGGTITLRNAGNLVVNAITARDGTVNLTSNTGSVGQLLVPSNSIWTGKLNVNAATDIDLAAQNITGLLGNLTASGSIRYNSFGTLGLDGDIRAGSGVTFGIQGYLGQYSGTIAASHLDVTATGIALIGENDIGSAIASRFAANDDITFRSVNSILLGAVTTPGLLSLTSDNGDIRQSAAFSAGRFDAIAAGDIVLEQLNTLNTVNDVTAGGMFSLRTSGALELDGRIAADDRVTFNTGGGLTQIGNTVIVTDRLEATAGTTTTGGIRLLNHNRIGAVSLDASGNDIRFRNTGNIAINAINAPTGTVELISNLGKITQQSSGGLVASSLILNAFNGVELYNNDNQIARLDVVSRGMVSIHSGGSGFGGLLTVDRIDAAGQTVSVNNYTWGITGGNISAETLTVFAAGDIDLGTTNNVTGNVGLSGRNIAFTNLGNLIIDRVLSPSGNAVLRSEEGAISHTAFALIDTVGLTAYGRDGVTLAGAIKRIDGLSAGPGADVEIVTDRALELAGDITARNVLLRSNMAPNVFTPTGGSIVQTGGIITTDLFRGSAYGAIDLRLGNQIAALGDVWSFTSSIGITSDRALDLTGALTATNGDVVLDAASIGQSGGSIEALGLSARATGAISLDAANLISATGTVTFDAGADIAFRNDGSFTLGMVDTPGAATFTSTNGSISQAASTRIGASRLSVSAANGGIALNEANLVDTLGGWTAGGAVAFRNTGDFALEGDIAAADHEVTLRSNTGAISQTSGTITALGLSAAASGAITLGGANSVTNLRDVTAGGDFLYRNATALMLWGDVTAAGHEVTLKTDSGSLLQMLFTSGIITANRLNASAGGALNFNHANRVNELGDYGSGSGVVGFTNDGSFALAGDISGDELVLQSLTGGITQTAGSIDTGSINASAVGSILLNRANQVAAAGPVRLVSDTGNVTFRALGDFTLDFGFAAGTFDVTSDTGSIGQSGLITANRLNARAGGDIILTGDNAVTNLGMLNAGGDIAFTAAGDLLLTDAIDAGGNVSLVANTGEITQSGGAITAASLNVMADRNIALGGANTVGAFAGTSATGDIALRNTGSISLGAVSLPGTFVLTSDAGAVTQTGDLAAGLLDVTARDGITLTQSGNAIAGAIRLANLGTGGIAYTGRGDILIGAIRANGQAVTLRAAGKIDQQAGIEAGILNLLATDATLLSAGNLIDTLGAVDVSSLSLSTDTGLDLAGAVTASGTVSLAVNGRLTQSGGLITAPSLSITASGGIDLGSINQVDALTATNSGGSGDVRFVNGRTLTVNNLVSDHGELTLRLTAGQLTLGGTIFSLGNMDLDAAGDIGGSASLDSRASLRAVSGGSIVLRSVSGRDDILINAAGDATVAELVHLSGGTDAAGNGYIVDILGNNVTLGASDPGTISGVHRLYVETSPVVRIGARAGNARLNLATMNGSVSIAATGDVLAYAVDDLNLTDIVGTNVDLTSANGDVIANRVDVAGNYSLAGRYFYNGALQPIGTRAGRWTLTTGGDLDASGRTLEFGGGIDFTVGGTLSNGSFRSLGGGVSITAGSVDLYQIAAANGVDVLANSGNLDLFSADTAAGNLSLTAGTVRVSGALAAGADIAVLATTGDAIIGYATAGRNIGITAQGDATLRQANLTGATGDLTIGAGGNATLGDDDAMSGIGTDRWFGRAVGSTGAASVTGGAGVSINLDRSAKLDSISGRRVEVNVATGDLTIGQLTALTERGIVKVLGGSLVIGSAAATGSALDLYADGDLTLLSSANGYSIYLTAGGLLDTRTATINGASYVELTGGEVRAGAITSGGDIDVLSTSGAIAVDSVHSTGGDAIFSAFTDLNLGNVVANGGQLQAGGNATLRAITAANGFALVALGNITLGADTVAQIAGSNLLATGGSLSGCACGSGGATLISLNGSVNVNLQSASGVFDTIAAGVSGDANVHVATGDLGIGDLAGHNIAVTLPGGMLTVMNPVSSGGNYTLTARDFAGNALLPIVGGGATRLNNVTITDTDGDLSAGGNLVAAGDIRINSVGNITGALSLLADGDVDVVARAIRLGDVAGRDIVLNASAGRVDVVGAVTVGRNYTLTGTGFFGNALAMTGTRAGDLFVTDTAGDFDYITLDLGFAGSATLRANGGAIRGGDIGTLGNLSLSASGVSAGLLRSTQGGVDVESSAGVALNQVQASNAIRISTGGDLRLGSAELSGTGVNAFTLAARGDLVFGASSAGAIGSGHVFSSAGSALTGGGVQADGAIAINLDRSAKFTDIGGGTLELTVRNGDLSIGGIRTVGALFVTGPAGALSIGEVETSAGHIGITGQGNVTTGAVNGRFVVNIGSSAGSLAFHKVTGGDVTLNAAGGITATGTNAGVFARSLGLTAGGNVDLATNGSGSRIGSLGAITVVHGGFVLNNLQNLDLDGAIDVPDGTLDLRVAGSLSQNTGAILTQRLIGSVAGYARLDGANRIASLGPLLADGLLLNNATALGIDGIVDGGASSVTIRARGGMTIGAAGAVRSTAAGDAITLASDGVFRNFAGGSALSAANGRWLVYTQAAGNAGASDPANDFGGLAGRSFYGAAYDFATGSFGAAPNTGNRFVYGYRPVLTVLPNNIVVTYDGQVPVLGASMTGLVNGDRAADAWSGTASLSGAGRNAGTYNIIASLGTLASDMNYDFAFGAGTLRIDPRTITATLAANGKAYDGTAAATGTLSLGGVIAGDTVGVSGSLAFADKNAGAGKTVTANGIALSGADAGNYTVNVTATALADIVARAITATLAANGKVYDGTAVATGALSLGGVIAGDTVNASGSYAFADKNAGNGKAVTASGIALSGADAGNYVVNTSTTALADILTRAITATLAANGKVYDGTAVATGALSLGGVLAGDTVNASGSYAFADKNVGTGKTVTASGIALNGADAGNYIVNTSATALAGILARAITATLTANGKTYDGTTAAIGNLSLDGVIAGDAVGVAGLLAFADRNAGASKTVTASGVALNGADAGNYTVNTTATAFADIFARAITATLTANGKTYDGTTSATGILSLDGLLAGDNVGVSGALAFADKNAGNGKAVTASGIALSGADAGNYVVNASATGLADIVARAITATLTANGKVYDGTVAATGALTLGGVLAGDTVSASGSYAFGDKNAGSGKTVTANGITLSGTDAGNYIVNTSATALADILARTITATLAANGKVYDGTAAATGNLSLDGVIAGDDVDVSGTLAFADKNAGAGKTVTASGITLNGADAGNYIVNMTATTLADILARTIAATLTANGKTYDGTAAATGTLSLGGVLAGDQVGVTGSYAFADKNAGNGKMVTASGIALTGADAGNYTVNVNATALADIVARAITATLAANGKVYDGTTAASGMLSLDGVLAGDAVSASGSYAFADKNTGTGKTVTASGITLNGADAGNYTVNLNATSLADILARTITATLAANGKVYDGTTAATGTLSLGGVIAGDDVGVSGALAFADRNAGKGKTVTASGIALNGADAGNYTVNATTSGLADILARTINATLAANGKVYDGTTAATGALSLSGLIAGDQVGVSGTYAFGDKNAGAGKTVMASGITLSGADATNYIVNGVATDVATIARLAITGTATADSRAYDGTPAATGRITLNGVLAGDTVSASAAYAFADRNAGTARTVSVNGVTLNGADAGNYTVTLGGGPVLADILRRAVTVQADDVTKLFGQRDPGFTWRVVGGSLVAGDGFTGELARAPGEQAGTYAINRGSLALSPNYSLTVVPGSLVIRFTQSGADSSDALHRRRPTSAFSLYEDPSVNLVGDAQGE